MSLTAQLRRRIGGLIFDKGLTGVQYLGRLHPRPPGSPRCGGDPQRALPARQSDHLLDIYIPRSLSPDLVPGRDPAVYAAPHPVVLYIHGGAFRILSKDTHWVMALAFARRGFLVFSINYRLAPRHPFPAALQDAAAALQFVSQKAGDYQGDLRRLVLAGESAGRTLSRRCRCFRCCRRRRRGRGRCTTAVWCRASFCRCAAFCRSAMPSASRDAEPAAVDSRSPQRDLGGLYRSGPRSRRDLAR